MEKEYLDIIFIIPAAILYWITLTFLSSHLAIVASKYLGIGLNYYKSGDAEKGKEFANKGLAKIEKAKIIEGFIPKFARIKPELSSY